MRQSYHGSRSPLRGTLRFILFQALPCTIDYTAGKRGKPEMVVPLPPASLTLAAGFPTRRLWRRPPQLLPPVPFRPCWTTTNKHQQNEGVTGNVKAVPYSHRETKVHLKEARISILRKNKARTTLQVLRSESCYSLPRPVPGAENEPHELRLLVGKSEAEIHGAVRLRVRGFC